MLLQVMISGGLLPQIAALFSMAQNFKWASKTFSTQALRLTRASVLTTAHSVTPEFPFTGRVLQRTGSSELRRKVIKWSVRAIILTSCMAIPVGSALASPLRATDLLSLVGISDGPGGRRVVISPNGAHVAYVTQ